MSREHLPPAAPCVPQPPHPRPLPYVHIGRHTYGLHTCCTCPWQGPLSFLGGVAGRRARGRWLSSHWTGGGFTLLPPIYISHIWCSLSWPCGQVGAAVFCRCCSGICVYALHGVDHGPPIWAGPRRPHAALSRRPVLRTCMRGAAVMAPRRGPSGPLRNGHYHVPQRPAMQDGRREQHGAATSQQHLLVLLLAWLWLWLARGRWGHNHTGCRRRFLLGLGCWARLRTGCGHVSRLTDEFCFVFCANTLIYTLFTGSGCAVATFVRPALLQRHGGRLIGA
jgi:hypothetical protein